MACFKLGGGVVVGEALASTGGALVLTAEASAAALAVACSACGAAAVLVVSGTGVLRVKLNQGCSKLSE